MEKLYCYTRISSHLQEDGHSLVTQWEVGQDVAKRNGLEPVLNSDQVVSAKSESLQYRPVLKDLVENLIPKGMVKNLYSKELTRLSRDNELSARLIKIFQKYDVHIYTKNFMYNFKDPLHEFHAMIEFGIAKIENAQRTDRIILNIKKGAELGKWPGVLPYGYKRQKKDPDEKGKGFLVINPEEADIVRQMYEMNLKGIGADKITTWLNDQDIPTRRGWSNWKAGVVSRILRNPLYKGQRIYSDGTIFKVPAIITDDLFDKVRKNASNNKPYITNAQKHFYLLRGLIKCKRDGHNWIGVNKPDQKMYYCLTKRSGYKYCGAKAISRPQLDDLIWTFMVDFLVYNNELRKWLKKKYESSPVELTSLIKTIDKLRHELKQKEEEEKRIVRKFAEGKLNDQVYDEYFSEINKAKSLLNEKISGEESKRQILESEDREYKELHHRLNELEKIKAIKDEQTKRRYIITLIDHLEIDWSDELQKHSIDVYFKDPRFNTTLLSDGTDLKDGRNLLNNSAEQISFYTTNNSTSTSDIV